MKKITPIIICLSISFYVFCGGKNYNELMKVPEEKFYNGKYTEAANLLKKDLKQSGDASGGKDGLLILMEAGSIFHTAKNYDLSNQILLKAARQTRYATVSVTNQIGALLSNPANADFAPQDFEKVLIRTYLGMNFLMKKDYEGARVEFKNVNEELQKIKDENSKARYKQSLMSKYLTALTFEISGEVNKDANDTEFAYIEYKQMQALRPDIEIVQRELQRLAKKLDRMDEYAEQIARFGKKDYVPDNAGELIVFFESGKAPIKKSRGSLLDNADMKGAIMVSLNTTSMAAGVTIAAVLLTMKSAENPIPYFVTRAHRTQFLQLYVNGVPYRTMVLDDIERTAIKNLEDDYNNLKSQVAASIVTKAIASIVAGLAAEQAAKALGGKKYAGLIGFVAGAGTGAALFSQMRPDLRCWHTLPANLQLTRIFLPPGKYVTQLNFVGNEKENRNETFEIVKGQKTFLHYRTVD